MNGTLMRELTHEIDKIPIIDTHEHILPESWTSEKGSNYSLIIRKRYAKEEVNLSFILNNSYRGWERKEVILEEWDSLKRFLDKVKGRAFYRSLFRALKELYDFNSSKINEDNWKKLSRRITEAYKEKNWQKKILKHKANIELIIWDQFWEIGCSGPQNLDSMLRYCILKKGVRTWEKYTRGIHQLLRQR